MSVTSNIEDTIVAPITAPGRAAVSVLRISGQAVPDLLKYLFPSRELYILRNPRKALYLPVHAIRVLNEEDLSTLGHGQILDHCILVYFPEPKSFTGEHVLEISLHGSPYLVQQLLSSLANANVRLARAGEFSERAYHNGRIDLTQAEAIADLINAETASQAKAARQQLEGQLSQVISDIGEPLRHLCAEMESWIDFPEEELDGLAIGAWLEKMQQVRDVCHRLSATFQIGRILREGANVVLIGEPNVGKSSLLNALVGEQRVIVSDIAGTTRDSIVERIELGGLLIRLWDTAGLDNGRAIDSLERAGIQQSWKRIEEADLLLLLMDLQTDFVLEPELMLRLAELNKPLLVVGNKIDCLNPELVDSVEQTVSRTFCDHNVVLISAHTGQGLDRLKELLVTQLTNRGKPEHSLLAESVVITSQRHWQMLYKALTSLDEAHRLILSKEPLELVTYEIRSALDSLSEIIGITTADDILGLVFSKFCIGK